MPLQTADACVAGPAKLVYTYDDVSPFLIHSYQLVDLGGAPGTLTVSFTLPVIGPVSASIDVNSGTQPAVDISFLGLHMTAGVKKYPTSAVPLSPPFNPTCSWSSA